MFKKYIIKWSIRQLSKMITSDKDYGKSTDYDIYNIDSSFDDITLSIKKINNVNNSIKNSNDSVIINNLKIIK